MYFSQFLIKSSHTISTKGHAIMAGPLRSAAAKLSHHGPRQALQPDD